MVAEFVGSYGLIVAMELGLSVANKANAWISVLKMWLQEMKKTKLQVCAVDQNFLETQHQQHHFGVECTLQLHIAKWNGLLKNVHAAIALIQRQ